MEGSDGMVRVTGQTDSQVSANVVSWSMTTSYPLCCVAMELATRLEAARLQLDLEWVPRATNQEADDLSNGKLAAFTPALRVPVDMRAQECHVLGRLMSEGAACYAATQDAKRRRGAA